MIDIKDSIIDALYKDKIDVSDVQSIISYGENTGEKVFDPVSKNFTVHSDVGYIHLWLTYHISGAKIILDDYYFNRTRISDVSDEPLAANAKISPYIEPYIAHELRCCKCDVQLEIRKVLFKYLKQSYHAAVLACPICGLVYEPKSLIEHQRDSIERVLQGK